MRTVSVPGLFLVIFVFCKLVGITAIAAWSWWWVLSPLWIVSLLALFIEIAAAVREAK